MCAQGKITKQRHRYVTNGRFSVTMQEKLKVDGGLAMQPLQLTLLGAFEARLQNRSLTTFATDKTRALLAYLALHANTPLRRETLAGLLWPDQPESQARQNLRQTLYRLRQALDKAQAGFGERLLQVTRQTVALDGTFCTVDVAHFWQAVAAIEAHERQAGGQRDIYLQRLETAVSYVKGELLAGFSLPDAPLFEEWLLAQRERLHHQSLLILHQLTSLYTQQGQYEPALMYAHRQIQQDPLREGAYRQAIYLLAINGRKSEALAQYQACRTVLQTELGVEPSPETQQLYADLVADKIVMADDGRVYYLPALHTAVVGRGAEIAAARRYLQDPDCRLLTIMGLGGVGKTTLAIMAAQEAATYPIFPDGIYFVPLAGVADEGLLAETIAQQLGLKVTAAAEAWTQIKRWLQSRDCLLVLDNFEHLLAGSAKLAALLTAAPQLKLLVTSRESLNIPAEQRLPLGGLAFPGVGEAGAAIDNFAAVQLFVQAAQRVQPDFRVTAANTTAIARICQLVQGMPLALEIAAAWLRLMDCERIVAEIRRNLDFLASSLRGMPERHQSMQAVFEHSWQLLAPREQVALIHLAHFRGGFTLEAALAITQATMVDLAALLDKSLLQRNENGRYTMHPLLRQFATWKQETEPRAPSIAEQHSHYYLAFVHQREAALLGAHSPQVINQIRQALDNIHLAWQTAVANRAWTHLQESVNGLSTYYRLSGLLSEAEILMEQTLAQLETAAAAPVLYGYLLEEQATIYIRQGRYAEAAHNGQQLLSLGEQRQNLDLTMRARVILGEVQQLLGNYDDALHDYEEAIAFYTSDDDKISESRVANLIGIVYRLQGKHDQALAHHQRALSISKAQGDRIHQALILGEMGALYTARSDAEQALACFQQALEIDRESGHREGIARNLHNMGRIYWPQGKYDEALNCFQQALHLAEALGIRRGISLCLNHIGIIYKHLHEYEQAQQYYQRALKISQELGIKEEIANNLSNLGNVYLLQKRYDEAESHYEAALQLTQEIGHIEGSARHLGNLATLYKEREEGERALATFDRAIAMLRQIDEKYARSELLIFKGELLMGQGQPAEALSFAREGLDLAEEIGRPDMIRQGNGLLAQLL